jgi:hypothetical protein
MALRGAGVDLADKGVMVAESAAGVLQFLADGNADIGAFPRSSRSAPGRRSPWCSCCAAARR